ncbi:GumC family protein [Acidicapsa acidisoli]|uniref:GumC family protein n=1 Tax=Acidicapsa acidisoli TaxID=1615681 RepID=UPI0021DFA06B|nr:Wzz/FepE/Etk N-terminal domain-containing protein [Acidicapsa acidisoli]
MKVEAINEEVREAQTLGKSPEALQLLDVLIILARRRRFIAGFTLGAVILTVIFVMVVPSKFTALTVLLPPAQNSSMSSALLGQLGGGGASALASVAGAGLGIKNPSDMYIALFRSRTIEDAMIGRFGLMERYHAKKLSQARAALEGHSTVILGAKDGLIRVTFSDRDPKMAAEFANGYVDEFRKLSATLAITEASQRRTFFQQQLLEANENLAKAEEAMKHTEQSTGVLQIDSQSRSLIESAANLRAQVVAKEVQLQGMRSYATEDNPDVVLAQQQLAALKSQLAQLAGTGQGDNTDLIMPKGKIPEAGMEYIRSLRDLRYYETISELIGKQFEIAKLDEARQGSIIQVVDLAIPPDNRSFPKRTITVAAVAVLSFFMACAWCVFFNGIREKNQDPGSRERMEALRAALRE